MNLGVFAILNPWLLLGLAALPAIYWLLRTVPPRPKEIIFPPTRILAGIETPEETPATTPWWLLLLRLAAAAAVILALSGPVLNPTPETGIGGTGPVALVVDNGWASASHWDAKQRIAERLINEAEAKGRPLLVLPTANAAKTLSARIEAPSAARTSLAALEPQPFPPDRLAAASALQSVLEASGPGSPAILWLTDGIDHDGTAAAFAQRLATIAKDGSVTVIEDQAGHEPLGVSVSHGGKARLEAKVQRTGGGQREATLTAFSARGEKLSEAAVTLTPGSTQAVATFDLPLELRNQVARIEIPSERSAGAVALFDARSRRPRVGILSGESREQAQPLLAPHYYITKALAPYADLTEPGNLNLLSGISAILKENAGILVLAGIGTLDGEVQARTAEWVEKGGILVRFAGPRLEHGGDDLLPVPLRNDGRSLGGALSWSSPQHLAPFDNTSIFAGLEVPKDVTINRQVLADPARMGPEVAVWARLEDGTPLVTAARRGEGQLVLFHITANSDWSNLPLSGLFVGMLRRISALARMSPAAEGGERSGAATPAGGRTAHLPPLETLDGFGILKPPPPSAQPVAVADLDRLKVSLDHPPGYYGPAADPRALNILDENTVLTPLPPLPAAIERRKAAGEGAIPLGPWFLAGALALLFADIVAIILMQIGGLLPSLEGRKAKGVKAGSTLGLLLLAAALAVPGEDAKAEPRRQPAARADAARPASTGAEDDIAVRATGKVTLAYVKTGDSATDETSRLGLEGLNRKLGERTAVEPGPPMGVDIINGEIAFYPVLYWPVLPSVQELDAKTVAKVDAYMKQGGMIIFDTRDYGQGMPAGFAQPGQGSVPLQRLLGRLDLPRLEPVPENHVLTKSFYLLRFFPGRWDGGQLWVEAGGNEAPDTAPKVHRSDGVTSILITSNDFAAAWALDERGQPLYPVVPGGEHQRELAFRTGINIVMHALTGNYKADQVHVPALLERLGQ